MEQNTEASQAVERRAEYDAFCEWVRETPSKPFSDMAWEAWKDGRARLRAALNAQPAPTEATEKPFGYFIVEGDDLPYPGSGFIRELAEGRLYRSVTPVYTRPAPTEAAQGEQLSGNSGELAQGEDSARLKFGDITSVVHNDRGTQHTLMIYFKTKVGRDGFRDVFGAMVLKDRARASAETGGVK